MDQNVINEIIRTNEMMQTKHIEPNTNEYDKLIYAFGKFMKNDMPDKAFACLYNAYPSNKDDCYPIIAQFRKDMTLQAKKGIKAAECLKILRKAYLLTARDKFDDFCIFTEWDRPPQDRFYVPRRKSLWTATEGLQDLADDKLDILGISLPPGAGKALANNTPVLTRNGWKNHGDLVVGDEVIGIDGKFKKVLQIHPKCMLDRLIEFTNGERIICHKNHEWQLLDRTSASEKTKSVEYWESRQIENDIIGRGHRYNLMLPKKQYVRGKHKHLGVHPYVMGAWLGDGTNRTPCITESKLDECIFEEVNRLGYPCIRTHVHKTTGVITKAFGGLRQALHSYGFCYDGRTVEKYIPEDYLTASAKQRLDLLAGLIDTDGTKSSEHKYAYSTTSEKLKDTFVELVSTFGWRCCVYAEEPKISTSGIVGRKRVYNISFTPDCYIPCRVQRKRLKSFGVQRKIAVKSINKIEPVEGNCITVEGGMYLAGKTMLPTHNSALALFYITWLVGKNPLEGILIGSHNGDILTDFYNECLRELDPTGDYRWHEVFPERKVVSTNAKAHKIDIDKAQRFSSLQFSSIGSGNAGKVRALQLLYCDDLIPGIEEALSAERLEKKWTLYNTDLRQRKYGNKCKELHIATRWSVHDVIGRLEDLYADTGRARFIRIPALDENGESNFDYGNGKGYSTAAFLDIQKTMDDISFQALYQNEPIEREGLLYHPDQLRRYYELPDREADAILAVCDTASGGGDDLVMPIFAVYGNDHYLIDCVVSNELPEVTDNLCVEALVRNRVKQCQFESNSAGGRTADKVEEGVKKLATSKGIKPTHITKKWTSQNKETKIIVNSAWVKEYCLFKDDKLIQSKSMYADFMKKMTTYTHKGKNKHDDVVDALAQYAVYTDSMSMNTISLLKRPF